MAKAPPLIHVGYHKTGTTWLQNVGFQKKHGFEQILSHSEVFEEIVRPHSLSFSTKTVKDIIQARLTEVEEGITPVISSELLCGNPFYGGRESSEYCDRLYEIVPDAKILFTIREQHKILVSTYMQYLYRGGTEDPKSFFLSEPSLGYFLFSVDHFKYDRLVKRYQERFGSENVMVVTQEDLQECSLDVLRNILSFSGRNFKLGNLSGPQRVVVSFPEVAYPLLRRVNYLRCRPAGRSAIVDLGRSGDILYESIGRAAYQLARVGKPRPIIRRFVEKNFRGVFVESNRILKNKLSHEINLTGYEL